MLERILSLLSPALSHAGAILVDGTLGMGGHSRALLEANPNARLIGIDQDENALAVAGEHLADFADRTTLVQARFDSLTQVLENAGVGATERGVDAILLDLGLSSLQIDEAERGFSYMHDASLDMRMDTTRELTAATIVNTYEASELVRIIRTYGEEKLAQRIVAQIVANRPINTTGELVAAIDQALPAAVRFRHGSSSHPAKRTFQALRIAVNAELEALQAVIPQALAALAVDGVLAIISFQSLEDRYVKDAFRTATQDSAPAGLPYVPEAFQARFVNLTRGAEVACEAEVNGNSRSASAKLRAVKRIKEDA
ncbi:MAG: 16S rRNA (cytosine(1402)-N(4))-methyltransferase RsmH [Propionibacteriaceae bacterium]|nr:16S rRNA (cytosine(1402)-N(4))-methyltransferase RsmH [Propionibacteriaceae bacterium]